MADVLLTVGILVALVAFLVDLLLGVVATRRRRRQQQRLIPECVLGHPVRAPKAPQAVRKAGGRTT
jgi:hypothetical protein